MGREGEGGGRAEQEGCEGEEPTLEGDDEVAGPEFARVADDARERRAPEQQQQHDAGQGRETEQAQPPRRLPSGMDASDPHADGQGHGDQVVLHEAPGHEGQRHHQQTARSHRAPQQDRQSGDLEGVPEHLWIVHRHVVGEVHRQGGHEQDPRGRAPPPRSGHRRDDPAGREGDDEERQEGHQAPGEDDVARGRSHRRHDPEGEWRVVVGDQRLVARIERPGVEHRVGVPRVPALVEVAPHRRGRLEQRQGQSGQERHPEGGRDEQTQARCGRGGRGRGVGGRHGSSRRAGA